MNLTLNRKPSLGGVTIGELLEGEERLCYTLEDEIRERDGVPVLEWKIKGETAIPAGRYRVSLENSPRFGPGTLTIHNVPGFVGVRMHAGNTAADTEGCPLLGMRVNNFSIVAGTSRKAVALVAARVRLAMTQGEGVWIDINNPTAVA